VSEERKVISQADAAPAKAAEARSAAVMDLT
jgi:hypothetical protein